MVPHQEKDPYSTQAPPRHECPKYQAALWPCGGPEIRGTSAVDPLEGALPRVTVDQRSILIPPPPESLSIQVEHKLTQLVNEQDGDKLKLFP